MIISYDELSGYPLSRTELADAIGQGKGDAHLFPRPQNNQRRGGEKKRSQNEAAVSL